VRDEEINNLRQQHWQFNPTTTQKSAAKEKELPVFGSPSNPVSSHHPFQKCFGRISLHLLLLLLCIHSSWGKETHMIRLIKSLWITSPQENKSRTSGYPAKWVIYLNLEFEKLPNVILYFAPVPSLYLNLFYPQLCCMNSNFSDFFSSLEVFQKGLGQIPVYSNIWAG
jgi:hypothetical protein